MESYSTFYQVWTGLGRFGQAGLDRFEQARTSWNKLEQVLEPLELMDPVLGLNLNLDQTTRRSLSD